MQDFFACIVAILLKKKKNVNIVLFIFKTLSSQPQ